MKRFAIILIIVLTACIAFFKVITASKSTPVVFNAPASNLTKVDITDSSFLRITLLTDKYRISLFEKSITTNQLDSVGNFITANKTQINKDKIVVIGNEKMKDFQSVVLLLKNNGVERFRVNAE